MINQATIDEIKAIVRNLSDNDGWALLSKVGLELKKRDIDYGDSLKSFFDSYKDYFVLKDFPSPSKTTGAPPIPKVRENDYEQKPKKPITSCSKNKFNETNPELRDWAYLPKGWKETIELLYDEIRKDEHWYFGEKQEDKNSYPILSNYLRYTFVRIYKEKKIRYSIPTAEKKYAAFNTGLVNDLYESIYAIFEKNKNEGQQEWCLWGFSPRGRGIGKVLLGYIDGVPQRAKYITEKDLMIPDGIVPSIDTDHIVDKLERLPNEYLKDLLDKKDLDLSKKTIEERRKMLDPFKQEILKDVQKMNSIKRDFRYAIEMSLKRVEWNYKTAIPVYWVKGDSISLLLPLALANGRDVDLAFVISRQPNGSYVGQTIYTLEMAYNDARLIVRPDSDWLVPTKINHSEKDNIEE